MVSESGEPIVSLMTVSRLLEPITTAIAVVMATSHRAVLDSMEIRRQLGWRGASTALASLLTPKTMPTTEKSDVR